MHIHPENENAAFRKSFFSSSRVR